MSSLVHLDFAASLPVPSSVRGCGERGGTGQNGVSEEGKASAKGGLNYSRSSKWIRVIVLIDVVGIPRLSLSICRTEA